jgi:hypothetical protein
MRLSQIDVAPQQLNAIFLTHIHGDHTEGLADVLMLRWYMKGSKLDIVCSSDAVSVFGFTNSCRNFVRHVADAFLQSGEIAERRSEVDDQTTCGSSFGSNVIRLSLIGWRSNVRGGYSCACFPGAACFLARWSPHGRLMPRTGPQAISRSSCRTRQAGRPT